MTIPFLDGFILIIDNEHESNNIVEDGLSTIGVLSEMVQDCTNLVAAIREGSPPSEHMLTQVTYSSSLLSGIVVNISDILVELEIRRP